MPFSSELPVCFVVISPTLVSVLLNSSVIVVTRP
jgi:hypothetical protein